MSAIWLLAGALALLAATVTARRAIASARVVRRVDALLLDREVAPAADEEPRDGRLARWLGRAGYRGSRAVALFGVACGVALLAGSALAVLVWIAGLAGAVLDGLDRIPGGLGRGLIPIAASGPALVALLVAALPWAYVLRRRSAMVEAVEQDLPITLELLATLAEAGFAFDAALAQVLAAETAGDRPLASELRHFQLELLAGRPRVECFRRLRERLDVPGVNVLVAALVTAEHLGASTSETLRTQATDLRGRRREQAMALAQGLPVKLIFPLMFCFLPGIFVVILGPAFYQLFQMADSVIRGAR